MSQLRLVGSIMSAADMPLMCSVGLFEILVQEPPDKKGPSLFLVGSACELLLGCEVQTAQAKEDHRPEVGDAPEAPGDAAGGLDDRVEAFQKRVGRTPLPPVEDTFSLLPEGPCHGLHLGHGRVRHPRAEALWGCCRRFSVSA